MTEIYAIEKKAVAVPSLILHRMTLSKKIESAVRSQPVYCADVYRERRYQMLCEYNFSS